MQNNKIDIKQLLAKGTKYSFTVDDKPVTVLYSKTDKPNNPLSNYEDIVVFRVKYSDTAPFEKGQWVKNKEQLKEYLLQIFSLNTDDDKKEKALNSLDFEVYTYADYKKDENKNSNIAYICIVGNDTNGDNDYVKDSAESEIYFIDAEDDNIVTMETRNESIEDIVSNVAQMISQDLENSIESENIEDEEFSLDFDNVDASAILANINQKYIDEEDYLYEDDNVDDIDFTVGLNSFPGYSGVSIDPDDDRLLSDVDDSEILGLVEYDDYIPLSAEERQQETLRNMQSISEEIDKDNQIEMLKTMITNNIMSIEDDDEENGQDYETLIIDMFKNDAYTSTLLSQYDDNFYENFNTIDYLDTIGKENINNENDFIETEENFSDIDYEDIDYLEENDFEDYLSNYDNSVFVDEEQRKSTAISAIEQLFNFKDGNIYDIYVLDKDNNILNVLENEAVDVDETSARIIANYYS